MLWIWSSISGPFGISLPLHVAPFRLVSFVRLQGFQPADSALFNTFVTSLSKSLVHQASVSASHIAFVGLKRRQFYLSHLPAYFSEVIKRAMLSSPLVCSDFLFAEPDIARMVADTQASASLRFQQALVDVASRGSGARCRHFSPSRRRRWESGSPSRQSKRVRFDSTAPSLALKGPCSGFRREGSCPSSGKVCVCVGGGGGGGSECLAVQWEVWESWGSDPWVVQVLRSGYRVPFHSQPPLSSVPLPLPSYSPNSVRGLALAAAVEALQEKEAMELAPPSLGFYSRLFVTPKVTGGWRPVIDLSCLHSLVDVSRFHMETTQSVLQSLHPGDWMVSLDLQVPRARSEAVVSFTVFPVKQRPSSVCVEQASGSHVLRVRPGSRCTAAHAVTPTSAECRGSLPAGRRLGLLPAGSSVVVRRVPAGGGSSSWLSATNRFCSPTPRIWVGVRLWEMTYVWVVVSGLFQLFDQPSGAIGGSLHCPGFPPQSSGPGCCTLHRQHHGTGVPEETGAPALRPSTRWLRLNVLADSLSRKSQVLGSEWTLCSEAFHQLLRNWPAMIDLFATSLNHRLPVYFSLMVDPQSAGTDALLQLWDDLQAYAFPPFGLIPRVLAKVRQSWRLEHALVAPFWAQHPWFPDLLELLVEIPFFLPRRRDLLKQLHFHYYHQNLPMLQLTAYRLSSDPHVISDSLRQWLGSLPTAVADLPE